MDGTMCEGLAARLDGTTVECARRLQCYRHTAPQNEYRQSWFTILPLIVLDDGSQECDYFASNEGRT